MTTPTWANHPSIFQAAGLQVESFRYFNPASNQIDFEAMTQDVEAMEPGDVIVLHGCCHNPCGADPSSEQWQTIAGLIRDRQLLPLIDFAYQGFADGIEEDAGGLRTVCDTVDELLICNSFSKNFGSVQRTRWRLDGCRQELGVKPKSR